MNGGWIRGLDGQDGRGKEMRASDGLTASSTRNYGWTSSDGVALRGQWAGGS